MAWLRGARTHVLAALTPQSYIESLRTIVEVFQRPMVERDVLPIERVAVIFCHVDKLMAKHEQFLEKVRERYREWTVLSTVGDLFVSETNFLRDYTRYGVFTLPSFVSLAFFGGG